MKDFSLFRKKCYRIAWSAEKIEKNGRIIILSKCAVCDIIKPRFIKQQEASRFSNSLGIKAPMSKILLVVPRMKTSSRRLFIFLKKYNTR